MIDEATNTADVAPSVLAAVMRTQGPLEMLAQVGAWARPARAGRVVRIGRWKLTVNDNGVATLADLVEDPGELRDYARIRPVERQMLIDAFGR